jgi:hypothetical protein
MEEEGSTNWSPTFPRDRDGERAVDYTVAGPLCCHVWLRRRLTVKEQGWLLLLEPNPRHRAPSVEYAATTMDPPASSIAGDGCVVHSTLAIDPALLHQTCRGCCLGLHQQPQEHTRIGNGQPGRGDQDAGLASNLCLARSPSPLSRRPLAASVGSCTCSISPCPPDASSCPLGRGGRRRHSKSWYAWFRA